MQNIANQKQRREMVAKTKQWEVGELWTVKDGFAPPPPSHPHSGESIFRGSKMTSLCAYFDSSPGAMFSWGLVKNVCPPIVSFYPSHDSRCLLAVDGSFTIIGM